MHQCAKPELSEMTEMLSTCSNAVVTSHRWLLLQMGLDWTAQDKSPLLYFLHKPHPYASSLIFSLGFFKMD